ncbi:MAG: hypothetical protein J7518_22735 [Nocardioidaceae bacterium]|nr:hypothetical protein [Nocardioidaceae bacterium]
MPVRASLTLRWARAAVLASVALGTGAVAHLSADGLLPGPGGLLVLALAWTTLAAMLLGRQASTLRLVALVVGGQAFVHTGLAAMAGHRGDPVTPHAAPSPLPMPTPHPVPRTGSYFDQWAQSRPQGGAAPAVPAWLVHAVADVAEHPAMALAHVLAAVAVGLWLAVGERALFALLALTLTLVVALVRRLASVLGPVPLVPRPVRRASYGLLRVPRRDVWSLGPVRRGPPFLLTAA